MGDNYYYESSVARPCEHCGRHDVVPRLHIGKSSAGWVFSLCIYPEQGIHSLEDWKRVFASGGQIRDEYGEFTPVAEMIALITQRSHRNGLRVYENGITRVIRSDEPTWRTTTETEFS